MNVGFIILTRLNSTRIPRKPLVELNGIPLIEHLVKRCLATGYPVCVATPSGDLESFKFLLDKIDNKNLTFFCGFDASPLKRMNAAMKDLGWTHAIRVSHDKIFISPYMVTALVNETVKNKNYYGIYEDPTDGTHIEVISGEALKNATSVFEDIEHITYAIRVLNKEITVLSVPREYKSQHRLLIDYPKDVQVISAILKTCGNDCSLEQAIAFLDQHSWLSRTNRLPLVSVYTCVYNAEKWITKAMGSVSMQQDFNRCEYILIDDASTDASNHLMSKFVRVYPNSKLIRNRTNLGLASSSNKALNEATGKYVIRLDADDYFIGDDSLSLLLKEIQANEYDAVYPNNYFGSFQKVQLGKDSHHIGGAIFKSKAANYVKFTEGLRGFEGLDFFERAKKILDVGYLDKPIFFYRQHKESLTKSDPELRSRIKSELQKKYNSV